MVLTVLCLICSIVHMMDTDYVAECLTVFHGNVAAIDRKRTDFMSGCRPSTY